VSRLLLVSAAALIDDAGRVLLARRPAGKPLAGLWELPGGKLEPGETPEAALVRECAEELGLVLAPADLEPLTFASHGYPDFHLLMAVFRCRRWQGTPRPTEGQAIRWFAADELDGLDLPPADRRLIAPLKRAMAAAVNPI